MESDDIRFKIVVFPAFALPIMRIRNLISWGRRGRIVSLLLVDDLELTCPILRRGEKETCKEVEHVWGMRRQTDCSTLENISLIGPVTTHCYGNGCAGSPAELRKPGVVATVQEKRVA